MKMQINKIFIMIPLKGIRKLYRLLNGFYNSIYTILVFQMNGIQYKSFKVTGRPFVSMPFTGSCSIGENFHINSSIIAGPTGNVLKSVLFISNNAQLIIGNNVGMTSASIICHVQIIIEDNVKIGAGAKIVDTDFHSLNSLVRLSEDDKAHKVMSPVLIKRNAFIGANAFVLKGVTIGENSIIGAGSVLTKSVPDNQIWAGNPARYIKDVL